MNKDEFNRLIYSGKFLLPLDAKTKKSYKTVVYRSTITSGKINKITLPELPDNYYIIGSEDIKGRKTININSSKIPILPKKINYIGEPILLLVGPDIDILMNLLEKISVDYITIPEEEIIFFSKEIKRGDIDNIFSNPYKLKTGIIKTPDKIINRKLPNGSFVKRETESLSIYTSSIWPSNLRDNIAALCTLKPNKVKVISPQITGEDMSPLFDSYLSAAYAAISASIIKKNVLFLMNNKDNELFPAKSYGLEAQWQMAYSEDNTIQGVKVEVTLNCGAYPLFVQEKVLRIIHGITSFYKYKSIHIVVNGVKSHLPPSEISESMNLSDALFISELLVAKIVKATRENQYNWRKLNLLTKGNRNSSQTVLKQVIPLKNLLEGVVINSDFLRKDSSINLSIIRKNSRVDLTKKRGLGISVGYNGNSFISNRKECLTHSVSLTLNRDGNVELKTSFRLSNLQIIPIWEEIISTTLDIPINNITISPENTSLIGDSGPNILNKNITVLTPLIKQCSDNIKARRFKDPLPIIELKNTRRISNNIWNPIEWKGSPFKNSSYAACAMEIEVDKQSLNCKIKEIWLGLEVGLVIDKTSLLKAINREVFSTIKWLKDQDLGSATQGNRPIVNIKIMETGKNKGIPKGLGSLISNTLPGAYIQGVNQALGSNISRFPITRDMIYKELIKDEV